MTAGRLDIALAVATDVDGLSYSWGWWEPHDWLRDLLAQPASATCPHRSAALGALSYTTILHEGDLPAAERLALASIDSRAAHPELVGPVRDAEITMSTVTMVRDDLAASLALAEQLIDAGQADDDWNLGWGLFYASIALTYSGRADEGRSLVDRLEGYYRRHPWAVAGFMVSLALGLAYKDTDPEQARHHFQLALEAGRALGSPVMTRAADAEAMSLLIAHAPLPEAAAAACEVIAAMGDGRDLASMLRVVAHSAVICVQAGLYHDVAKIDGWLGERGGNLVPGDLTRYRQAQHDVDARLGDSAARLRSRGAQWDPATATEHILTTLRAISKTPAQPPPP